MSDLVDINRVGILLKKKLKKQKQELIAEFLSDYNFLLKIWQDGGIVSTEDIEKIYKEKEKWEKRLEESLKN